MRGENVVSEFVGERKAFSAGLTNIPVDGDFPFWGADDPDECALEALRVHFGDGDSDGGRDLVQPLAAVVPDRGKESLDVHRHGIDGIAHSSFASRRRSASRASKRSSSFLESSPSLRYARAIWTFGMTGGGCVSPLIQEVAFASACLESFGSASGGPVRSMTCCK